MRTLMIVISTNDPETAYNAMRLAITGVGKGDGKACRSDHEPDSFRPARIIPD